MLSYAVCRLWPWCSSLKTLVPYTPPPSSRSFSGSAAHSVLHPLPHVALLVSLFVVCFGGVPIFYNFIKEAKLWK